MLAAFKLGRQVRRRLLPPAGSGAHQTFHPGAEYFGGGGAGDKVIRAGSKGFDPPLRRAAHCNDRQQHGHRVLFKDAAQREP